MAELLTTKGGAQLELRCAPMQDALELKNAVIAGLKGASLDFGKLQNIAEADLSEFVDVFSSIGSSKRIEDAIFKCAIQCTYNKAKITLDMFDDNEKARGDYYEIVMGVAKINLSPFFGSLFSALSGTAKELAKAQK